jgi:predicted unusual protein kinase regulating ubiquinone biosynthesis (AarF/ABC1/UbiB family)
MILLRAARIAWISAVLVAFAVRERIWRGAEPGLPQRLRMSLESLGPTFVKLG